MDTLPSGVPPKELPLPLSGQRGITPAFGYDAPHLGVRGTSTLLSNVLLSTHYAAVRLLGDVHTDRTASAFARRPASLRRHLRGLPVLVQEVSRRVWGLRLRRTDPRLALSPRLMWPSAGSDRVGVLIARFRSSIPSPPIPLFTLRWTPRGAQRKTRGRVDRYSFLVRNFHPLLSAGLSRRYRPSFQRLNLKRSLPVVFFLERVCFEPVQELPTVFVELCDDQETVAVVYYGAENESAPAEPAARKISLKRRSDVAAVARSPHRLTRAISRSRLGQLQTREG